MPHVPEAKLPVWAHVPINTVIVSYALNTRQNDIGNNSDTLLSVLPAAF